MWNKKRAHGLLIVEILAAFLVLFGVSSLIIKSLRNYNEPIGYEYKNVWAIDFNSNGANISDSLKIEVLQQVKVRAAAYPEVEASSWVSNNSPMAMSSMTNSVEYNKTSISANSLNVDKDFAKVMGVAVREGRWFDKADESGDQEVVVINEPLKKALFGEGQAVGKIINEGTKCRVVGVIGNFKPGGEYQENALCIFRLAKGQQQAWTSNLLVKVKPGTDAVFEGKMMKDFGNLAKGWNLDLSYMEKQRKNQHNLVLVPVIIFLIISGFLLINVALGLFGILNLSIAKRREEIGLRRALGATESGISWQFVGEIWVIATFGLLIGLLFAVQFPLMNVFDLDTSIYVMAILVSIAVIYGIVTLCAFYPSRQAATIQPALALHEE
ncbi:ABC transporter permease [Tellurirhabdus bombi]|uniref:ABC transporter permease n=1 Tax=Tellurirhabdus bombi TaxID=2907205 RepID=UPI001F1FA6E5|nr:ABC transporter permease [Tellurirhabdus bombi]